MIIASSNKPSVILGLLVCALGISVSSSADARKANRQGTYVEQGYPNPTPGITAMPRNTPKANIVCWTPCGRPGAIVLGADPDPNIRAFLLRDAIGYFGGVGRDKVRLPVKREPEWGTRQHALESKTPRACACPR